MADREVTDLTTWASMVPSKTTLKLDLHPVATYLAVARFGSSSSVVAMSPHVGSFHPVGRLLSVASSLVVLVVMVVVLQESSFHFLVLVLLLYY